MHGSQACSRCGATVALDAVWCGKCGLVRGAPQAEPATQDTPADPAPASSGTSSMPIGQRAWSWFKRSWRSASTALKVALGALFACAAYVYFFLGPVVFDVSYWALGKVIRVQADRRFRIGISAALVVAYLGVLGVVGSTQSRPEGARATSTPIAAAVVTDQPSRPTVAAMVDLTTEPSPTAAVPTQGQSASPEASSPDLDDAASSSAGPSFVATATGVVPPTSGGSPTDRLPGEPDPVLTPGALNLDVTQATIGSTICVSGWTATVRPGSSYTTALKIQQIIEYGYSETRTSSYEEDHLIPLELGGAPADRRNLWPEPYTITLADGRSTGAYTKDGFETTLKHQVCAGTITLAEAQGQIGIHWIHSYYGIALSTPTSPPPTASATAAPTAHVTSPPAPPVVTAPPPASLSVTITSLPASVGHGANATLVAVTSPGATCTASVTYASGTVSTASGLQTKPVADSSGAVSWTWKVGTNTGPGTSTASARCTLGGASASDSRTFVVT